VFLRFLLKVSRDVQDYFSGINVSIISTAFSQPLAEYSLRQGLKFLAGILCHLTTLKK
jgi:hypothetical protein